MIESPQLLNVVDLKKRHAMDTSHMEHAHVYSARANGLIKSASTGTCCANENALFKKAYLKFLSQENGECERTAEEQQYVRSLVPSLSLSQASAFTRNAPIFADENAIKKTLQVKLHLNHSKHFSDCSLNNIGLPIQKIEPRKSECKCEAFSSHRNLDNLLIDRSAKGGSGAIMNFTAVNDLKNESSQRNAVSKPSTQNGIKAKLSERRRKNNVFETPTLVSDKTSEPKYTQNEAVLSDNSHDKNSEKPKEKQEISKTKEMNVICCKKEEEPAPRPQTPTTPEIPKKEENRFRRSSSLKMPKEGNSTPAEKKIVRFADALGLDLADVRTFLDELPSVPKSAYTDLQNEVSVNKVNVSPAVAAETKTLVPMFKQPHTSLNFLDRVRDNYVSLEFAKVCPTPVCSISGTVRVRNLDFCKSVYVRYTIDNWRTFNELQAVYVPDSYDGFSDKFAFVIYVYDVKVNQRVELAVRFHCSGSIFWDSNNGSNYVFQCLPSAPIAPSYFRCYQASGDSCNFFY